MKSWKYIAPALLALLLPGTALLADQHEEAQEDQKIYLDEEYDEERDWAIGIGLGLVELGDNFVEGGTVVSDDDVEQYLTIGVRVPFGDRHAHRSSSASGFRGYLEPELAYWDSDFSSDLLFGVNVVGAMPFNAVEFYVGGGIGMHFIDNDFVVPGGQDSDEALGVNAHFGVDVSVSDRLSVYGTGRFDLVDDDRDELEGKAGVGLRFRF